MNPDCTGSATLSFGANTADALTRHINFVLTREMVTSTGNFRGVMDFVFSDPGTAGGGVAKEQ